MPDYSHSGLGELLYVGTNRQGANTLLSSNTNTVGIYNHTAKKFTAPASGILLGIDVLVSGDGSHINALYAGLANDNGGTLTRDMASIGTYPGETTGSTPFFNGLWTSTPRWTSMAVNCAVQAGSSYWMVVTWGGGFFGHSLYYDTGGSDLEANQVNNVTWFDPIFGGNMVTNSRNFSIRGALLC